MKKHFPVLLTFLVLGLGFISFGLVQSMKSSLPASSINSQPLASKVYLLGGGNTQTNSLISSTDGYNWNVDATALSFPQRINTTFLPFKTGFIVFGGYGYNNGSFNYNDVWSSLDGISWARILEHAPWSKRSGNGGIVFNNALYMFGGETYNASGSTFYNDVWKSVDGMHWVKQGDAPWTARSVGAAFVFKNKVWLIGGGSYNVNEDGTYDFQTYKDIWSFDGTTWIKELDQSPWDATGPTATFVQDEKLFVIVDDGLSSNTSVWSTTDGVNYEKVSDMPGFPQYNYTSFTQAGRMWLAGGTLDEEPYSGLWSSIDGVTWQDMGITLPAFSGEGHSSLVK